MSVVSNNENQNDSMKLYERSSNATQSLITSIEAIVDQYTKVSMDTEMLDADATNQTIKKEQTAMTMNLLTLKKNQRNLGLLLAGGEGSGSGSGSAGGVTTSSTITGGGEGGKGGGDGSCSLSEKVSAKRSQVEHQALTLQNIIYEKNHLVNEIRACKQVSCTHLLKMAREEVNNPHDVNADADGNVNVGDKQDDTETDTELTPEDEEKIISQFLAPAKAKAKANVGTGSNSSSSYVYHDASHHSYNLSKMHSELTTRGTLQSKLQKREKEKMQLVQELEKKKKFVADLPKHVAALEKSARSLQDYFLNVGPTVTAVVNAKNEGGREDDGNLSVLQLGALDRKERFKLAMDLKAPLYALFLQFQGYIDATRLSRSNDNENSKGSHANHLELRVVDALQGRQTQGASSSSDPTVDELVNLYTRKEPKALQLCIPIPSIDIHLNLSSRPPSSTSTKTVKIQFEYLDQLKIIVAHVVKDKAAASLWEEGKLLLQNLFQDDDDGRDIPCGSAADIMYQDVVDSTDISTNHDGDSGVEDMNMDEDIAMGENNDIGGVDVQEVHDPEGAMSPQQIALGKIRQSLRNEENDDIVGRPYSWCQYLAGLNYPSKMNVHIESTTKAILQQLCRRVHSHAALTGLIGKLKSVINPVPIHPSVQESADSEHAGSSGIDTSLTKLVEFGEDVTSATTSTTNGKKYFAVIKRKAKTIKVTVYIDVRYPAVPPLWSLQEAVIRKEATHLNSSELPLFDSTLGQIESRVNSLDGDGIFFNDDIEDSFYWILMQQLHIIIAEWTAYQAAIDPNGTKNENRIAGRKRKGRDRRPVASCFQLYQRGL